MQKLITEVRRFRSDQGLADRQKVPARLLGRRRRRSRRAGSGGHALAWLTAACRRLHPVGLSGGAAVARHRHRRARHVGHRRRRRRTAPAGEGSGRGAEGAGAAPPASSATRRSWPRRPPMSSTRSVAASSWPATKWSASPPGLTGCRMTEPDRRRTRSRRCSRSSTCSTSAGQRPRSNRAPRGSRR